MTIVLIKRTYHTELLVDREDFVGDACSICLLAFANLVADGARQEHHLLVLFVEVYVIFCDLRFKGTLSWWCISIETKSAVC